MFHCEEYNDDNVARLQKWLDEMKDLELCYRHDPTDPILVTKRAMKNNPDKYCSYKSLEDAGKQA